MIWAMAMTVRGGPPPDMPIGYLTVNHSVWVLVIWGLPVILIEAILLRFLLPKVRVFRVAFVMNYSTTLLGLVLALITPLWPYEVVGEFLGMTGSTLYYDNDALLLDSIIFFVILGIVGILIEGVILQRLATNAPRQRVWVAALVSNVVSYAVVFLLYVLQMAG
jgi:uncharacterized membrane protein YeaQ/YmgE (transglycosylase-associated protein family)